MPLYRTALRMAHDNRAPARRKWSTTFFINAANASAAAAAVAAAWVSELREGARDNVFAYEVYATDLTPGTDDYAVVSIPTGSQRGTHAMPTTGDVQWYLPKAVLAVTLDVAGSRPSRKFWRPGLLEVDVYNGVATDPVVLGWVRDAFTAFVTALGASLVDPDGQAITGVGRIKLTTREFGRTAGSDVPEPPALG